MLNIEAIRARYDKAHERPCEQMRVQEIAQLRIDLRRLLSEIGRVMAERDAAVKDLKLSAYCRTCSKDCGVTESLSKRSRGRCGDYVWRGMQEKGE